MAMMNWRDLDVLIDKVILYPDTTNEELAEILRQFIRHMMDSQEYPLGYNTMAGSTDLKVSLFLKTVLTSLPKTKMGESCSDSTR